MILSVIGRLSHGTMEEKTQLDQPELWILNLDCSFEMVTAGKEQSHHGPAFHMNMLRSLQLALVQSKLVTSTSSHAMVSPSAIDS